MLKSSQRGFFLLYSNPVNNTVLIKHRKLILEMLHKIVSNKQKNWANRICKKAMESVFLTRICIINDVSKIADYSYLFSKLRHINILVIGLICILKDNIKKAEGEEKKQMGQIIQKGSGSIQILLFFELISFWLKTFRCLNWNGFYNKSERFALYSIK